MRPQDLTTAKTVAKISMVSNTAGGKKSVARRSTGLDYSSSRTGDRSMQQRRVIADDYDRPRRSSLRDPDPRVTRAVLPPRLSRSKI